MLSHSELCSHSTSEHTLINYAEIRTSLHKTNRYKNFYEAEKILMEDAYIIPLFFYTNPVLVNNEAISNWDLSSTGKFWFGETDVTDAAA